MSGLERDYQSTHGKKRAAEEVIGLMRDGDAQARASFHRYSDRLARALATIGSYVFSDTWATKLVAARWGDSSGVRGAARL